MLEENEWNTISSILLELYTLNDVKVLSRKFLNVLRMMIQFSKGYFLCLDEDQKIIQENSVFMGFEESLSEKYISEYYNKDYLQYLYDFSKETTVFQDSSILADDIRKKTDFYVKFLKPSDIPFGAGIILVKNNRIQGIFNLFRSEKLGDFNEKDMYILNVFKRHLENMISSASIQNRQNIIVEKCFDDAEKRFNFSERETEILHLIADGKSNAEICDRLYVSLSTVKKHVYNIFNKAGVNSRTQLLNLIYSDCN